MKAFFPEFTMLFPVLAFVGNVVNFVSFRETSIVLATKTNSYGYDFALEIARNPKRKYSLLSTVAFVQLSNGLKTRRPRSGRKVVLYISNPSFLVIPNMLKKCSDVQI